MVMFWGCDAKVGVGIFSACCVAILYLTVWMIVLPFVDPEQPIHKWFPSQIYGILLADVIVVLFVVGTYFYIKWVQKEDNRKHD